MINQLLHTAILVRDLERSQQFYGEFLGLQPVDRPLSYRGVWYQLQGYQLHLIEDVNYTHELHQRDRWGRNPHIAFGVKELRPMEEQLKHKGYPFQPSGSGRAAIFCQDPDGHIIEITEV